MGQKVRSGAEAPPNAEETLPVPLYSMGIASYSPPMYALTS